LFILIRWYFIISSLYPFPRDHLNGPRITFVQERDLFIGLTNSMSTFLKRQIWFPCALTLPMADMIIVAADNSVRLDVIAAKCLTRALPS
jgi:hypothetical protein